MASVMSVDARITKGPAVASLWRSPEDAVVLTQLIADHEVLVMGRTTYEAVRPPLDAKHLRLVMASNPEQFADQAVANQLEFTALSPQELLPALEARGYEKVLLLGGKVNMAFLAAGLIDDIYITLEPAIFGDGTLLTESLPSVVTLCLESSKQLNDQGTLLLHYVVTKKKLTMYAQAR